MQAEILVLEDDGVLNGMIGYHLSRAGYAVTAAHAGGSKGSAGWEDLCDGVVGCESARW